jgi:hypothetical protein
MACVDVSTDAAHCGACDVICPAPVNATATCDASHCGFVCSRGYTARGADCIPVPRPIAPVSTGFVTSRRPTFRWIAAAGTADSTIDLCIDRVCTTIVSSSHVVGTTFTPPTELPTGVVYWRLHPATSSTVSSATWQFTVGAGSAAVDTSWGSTLDVNGDGYSDIAVGAPGASSNTGRAYLYLDGASGLATAAATSLTGSDGTNAWFGYRVVSAGDVNGDGYADLAIGAPGAITLDSSGHMVLPASPGRVYVYLGSPSGLDATPATSLTGPDGPASFFGDRVDGAGDVNGDGYADLIVGATGASSNTGRAYLYLGGESGLATAAATILSGADPSGAFGSVAGVGDVNGDGYADIAIGATNASSGAGRAHLYLGSASGLRVTAAATLASPDGTDVDFGGVADAGDVNGDGYADLAVAALIGVAGPSMYTGRAYVFLGGASGVASTPATSLTSPDAAAFGTFVAGAGDVNGDGYADIAVGSPFAAADIGHAYVYLGSASGLVATPATSLVGPDPLGLFGVVADAGDLNHDGFADIVVGAAGTGSNAGHAYVYFGGAFGLNTTSAASFTGLDGPNGLFGQSVY